MAPAPDPTSTSEPPQVSHQPSSEQPQHDEPTTETHTHILPPPFTNSDLSPLTQGAEALVYRTTFLTPSTPAVLKYRPPKPYRHPILDKRLTKARLLAEARVLVKCRREGVNVPAVLGADWEGGWLVMEFVEGGTVRGVLDEWVHSGGEEGEEIRGVMRGVGKAVAGLHRVGVCHGDLTTSNLMVRKGGKKEQEPGRRRGRPTTSAMREDAITAADSQAAPPPPSTTQTSREPEIVLIDFGLATQTVQDEDRAVDLYVLERAFAATHPAAEALFQEVLRAYKEGWKEGGKVLRRLEEVRLRGRKRSMLG